MRKKEMKKDIDIGRGRQPHCNGRGPCARRRNNRSGFDLPPVKYLPDTKEWDRRFEEMFKKMEECGEYHIDDKIKFENLNVKDIGDGIIEFHHTLREVIKNTSKVLQKIEVKDIAENPTHNNLALVLDTNKISKDDVKPLYRYISFLKSHDEMTFNKLFAISGITDVGDNLLDIKLDSVKLSAIEEHDYDSVIGLRYLISTFLVKLNPLVVALNIFNDGLRSSISTPYYYMKLISKASYRVLESITGAVFNSIKVDGEDYLLFGMTHSPLFDDVGVRSDKMKKKIEELKRTKPRVINQLYYHDKYQ